MDGDDSIFVTIKEMMQILKRSRAQVDRYRRQSSFPDGFVPHGAGNGGVLYLRSEFFEWMRTRPRRRPRPPA